MADLSQLIVLTIILLTYDVRFHIAHFLLSYPEGNYGKSINPQYSMLPKNNQQGDD